MVVFADNPESMRKTSDCGPLRRVPARAAQAIGAERWPGRLQMVCGKQKPATPFDHAFAGAHAQFAAGPREGAEEFFLARQPAEPVDKARFAEGKGRKWKGFCGLLEAPCRALMRAWRPLEDAGGRAALQPMETTKLVFVGARALALRSPGAGVSKGCPSLSMGGRLPAANEHPSRCIAFGNARLRMKFVYRAGS